MTRLYLVAAALILGCVMIFFAPIFALFIILMGIWIILTGDITINGDDSDEQHRMGNGKFTENNP
jgi:hypothetical protein